MRKFLGIGFFVAALVFSGQFAMAEGPILNGELESTITVNNIDNSAIGTESEAEIHVGSVLTGEVTGEVESTVAANNITNSADGTESEASVSLGSVGE